MIAEFSSEELDFRPTPSPSISVQAIELEESILGAILLDPAAIALTEGLPIQAFSISSHRQIFGVMRELHSQNLQPDLPTVALRMTEQGILQSAGGKSKLASLLDRTVHSGNTRQYVRLLQENYYRRYLSESFSRMAMLAETEVDLGSTFQQAQNQLDKIRTVKPQGGNS